MGSPPPRKAYALRIDPQLFDAVERLAGVELRSVNAEIECLLREALARRGIKLGAAPARPRGRPRKEDDDDA